MKKVRKKVTYLSNETVVCNLSSVWLHLFDSVEIGNCCPKLSYFIYTLCQTTYFQLNQFHLSFQIQQNHKKSTVIGEDLSSHVFPVAYFLLFQFVARPAFPNLSYVTGDWFIYWLSLPKGICDCDFNWKCQHVPQHSLGPSMFRNQFILNRAESENFLFFVNGLLLTYSATSLF